VRIEVGDIRDRATDEAFDIVTLYNNIYYFPVEERVPLLRHVGTFLKADGMLLVTTCCQGGSVGVEALNLWGAATATGGRLPSVEEDGWPASRRRRSGRRGYQTDPER